MATFKVGDRVRVTERGSKYYEKTGTIWKINPHGSWGINARQHGVRDGETAHRLEIDGMGRDHYDGISWIAFAAWQLAPLTDPGADAWASEQVRKWTKPEPVTPVVVKEKA